ncbi:ABC-2 type transport system permease protein [Rheinheimera pacifica]|uniref:ABC-2 type transport system permease protein n=1 Tax=Rheinheimera pacifica TaxID=173990 RepID=A0A1H6KQM6_9GAMM|nr:ABC transporter permease [Rheinheimera pacifica]SEH73832.1 ABC-2 type transport system permease protein [Rheinheimera pacifica]
MQHKLANVYRLGVKELWSLWRDPMMLLLILYSFSASIYIAGTSMPETLHKAPIAVVDEDQSGLSSRIISAFYLPYFMPPQLINLSDVDAALDAGVYSFVLNIPPAFEQDTLAGRSPKVQLSVDATRISQAFSGSGYIEQIVSSEISEFSQRQRLNTSLPVDLVLRASFNPNLTASWFGSLMEVVNGVTMISIILTGAALIREREHGTIEHLLVMPVTPGEIMLSKILSMGLVVLVATAFSLMVMIKIVLAVPVEGSVLLFLFCTALQLFATTSMGIFLATVARSMPQFGLLLILVLLPLQLLSGGMTPRESMPDLIQTIMLAAPNTHFVSASQAILYRGAGLSVVWPQMLALLLIGTLLFSFSLQRFRKSLSAM